ncbi:kinase-like domain-containing protein [Gigaspora rosea]|uniref:Kinase-like domain-containing protein n=1 Tax=Gigaspora rosea TaxID=44941 RepID=A0A397UCK2_9GLOM|nr:kinase-like domain-containing protein [Gigaspora rosea]
MSDWYERAIKDEYINSYDYESFKKKKHIGKGGVGTVYSAYSEDIDETIALKSLNDDLIDENKFHEFVREVKNIIKVHNHANIIKFFGFTKDTTTGTGLSYMVLQFANNGDLRSYLRDHFSELNWSTKIKMAKDISNGLKCLHKANIVHRDLHDKNILVNDSRLMIADFGLSKSLGSTSNSLAGGTLLYSDPKYMENPYLFKREKPSDIYSLGVLFWELSSGVPPFKNISGETIIARKIISGKREDPINGTPIDFMNLYCDAWNGDPNSRPDITEICHKLNSIQLLPVYKDFKTFEYTFEYKSFKDWKKLGEGGFGSTYSAYSEDIGQTVALKELSYRDEKSYNDFVKIITKVPYHDNIIQFFGITKDPETETYYMVHQFANNGNLRRYLLKHFSELDWPTKIKMAKDISNGVKCFHKANIVHCNLHPGNIVVNNGKLMIADFEFSKSLEKTDESSSVGNIYGVLPYVAPEVLLGKSRYTQATDIYGFGVIMSDMSTGQMPFDGQSYDTRLAYNICCRGLQLEFAPETPKCYLELAKKCMDRDPQKRPEAYQIYETISNWLDEIASSDDNEIKKQFLNAPIPVKPVKKEDSSRYSSRPVSPELLIQELELN